MGCWARKVLQTIGSSSWTVPESQEKGGRLLFKWIIPTEWSEARLTVRTPGRFNKTALLGQLIGRNFSFNHSILQREAEG